MKKSDKYNQEAKKLIPALSQTFSKAPYSYVEGVYPTYLSHGKGSRVFDIDNKKYIDFVLGLGPITLGHNYSAINSAIKKQLSKCISFSIPHHIEVEASQAINSIILGVEMIRFTKTNRVVTL